MDSIYLDHNATTPIRPEVTEAMARCCAEGYANPASQHRPGQRARQVLEDAREAIAEILGANLCASPPDRLVFTSGGTEANTWAVLGMARAASGGQPGQVIVSAVEHASVIEPAEHLMEQGWRLDLLGVDPDGVVRLERLRQLITPEARLASVTLGNHETGVLQPVADLAPICREAGVPLHTDAVQVAGKRPTDFRALGVSAMTVAAHKFHGPVGIGALVLRHDAQIEPILYGGHQQEGLRPGTEPVALAAGMRTALELWQKDHEAHARRLTALRDRFETGLRLALPEVVVNGSRASRLPHTSSVAFPGLDAQVLLVALDTSGVACSVGSACSSGSTDLSPTLRAMQLPPEILAGSLRFSLGATTTEAEIDEAVRRIVRVVGEMREVEG